MLNMINTILKPNLQDKAARLLGMLNMINTIHLYGTKMFR